MIENINVDLLNKVSDEIKFVECKVKDAIGVFLIDEKYTGGSLWHVSVSGVDFESEESIKTFLNEFSDQGESESFEYLEEAKEAYDQIVN